MTSNCYMCMLVYTNEYNLAVNGGWVKGLEGSGNSLFEDSVPARRA